LACGAVATLVTTKTKGSATARPYAKVRREHARRASA
jgi:hypothetical protein